MQHRIPTHADLADPPFLTFCHDTVKAIYRYWADKRNGRTMPSRRDIDPVEMKIWLTHLMLIDVLSQEPRFVYRLVGTGEVAQRRRDPTGKSVADAFFAADAAQALVHYEHVVTTRGPFFWNAPYQTPSGRTAHDDIIFLPLSDDDENVNMVMVFTHIRIKDQEPD